MAHYCKNCKYSPGVVLQEAIKFFGPDGLGLRIKEEVKERKEYCACLEADKGHIFIKARRKEKGTEVEVETHKWDHELKQFLEKV